VESKNTIFYDHVHAEKLTPAYNKFSQTAPKYTHLNFQSAPINPLKTEKGSEEKKIIFKALPFMR